MQRESARPGVARRPESGQFRRAMRLLALFPALLALIGACYLVAAAWLVARFARAGAQAGEGAATPPGITVLKPLHGAEAGLEASLVSTVEQAYAGPYQVLFGVRDAADPAAAVVRRIIAERPGRDLELVVDPSVRGTNYKIANLENMASRAKHPILVIADSDISVGPTWAEEVTRPLEDQAVGLVTCLYRGRPAWGLYPMLGAMFVNYAFLPSAILGEKLDPGRGCFGATMALRRATLDAVGGLAPFRDLLADDYALGEAVRRTGSRVVLSRTLVDTAVTEPTVGELWRHELRWQRTIRLLSPKGFAGSIVTHPLALSLLAALLSLFALPYLVLFLLILALRVATARAIDRAIWLAPAPLWAWPIRDSLSFAVFVASFCGRKIAWRGRAFRLARDGRLVADGDHST